MEAPTHIAAQSRWTLFDSGALVEALPQSLPTTSEFSDRIVLFSVGRDHPPGIFLSTVTHQAGAAIGALPFDAHEPAFDPLWTVSTKIAVAMNVHGVEYRRQIPARRSTAGAPSVSKGKLLATLAQEVRRFMDQAAQQGTPLRHNGANVAFDQLVIYGVRQISRGAWTPMLAVTVGWPAL